MRRGRRWFQARAVLAALVAPALIGAAGALATAGCAGELVAPGGGAGDPDAQVGVVSGPDAAGGAGEADAGAPPVADAGPRPGDGVVWFTWPEQHMASNASWGDALTDIARHLPTSYGSTYADPDKVTHGHETSHGIHAHLRNYHNPTGKRANAFYVLGDRVAFVVEPNIRKSQIAPYVPASLRGFRYGTYVTGQTAWDDTPLYVWDEWNAYVNGGAVGVDLAMAGKWTYGWRDAVSGVIEFVGYALATAMAVEALDPGYFASNTQFREFLAWNLERSMAIFLAGRTFPDFAWAEQDALWQSLKTSPDADAMRQFARRTFGDAWCLEVLGF